VLQLGDPNVEAAFRVPGALPTGASHLTLENTADGCSNTFTAGEITVFTRFLHMHQVGVRMKTTQMRAGEEVRQDYVDFYDFRQSGGFEPRSTADGFKVKKGDSFKVECWYETQAGDPRRFGQGSADEMCIDFLYYYPAQASVPNDGKCRPDMADGFPQPRPVDAIQRAFAGEPPATCWSLPPTTPPPPAPAPVVTAPSDTKFFVTVSVTLPYAKADFDEVKQSKYRTAVAAAAGTSAVNVEIISVTEALRRAGGIAVNTKIRASDQTGMEGIAASLGSGGELKRRLNTQLTAQGLEESTGVSAPVTAEVTLQEQGAKQDVAGPAAWVVGVAVGGGLVVLAGAACFFWALVGRGDQALRKDVGTGRADAVEASQQLPAVQPPPPPSTNAPQHVRFCSSCGSAVDPSFGTAFCVCCGQRL